MLHSTQQGSQKDESCSRNWQGKPLTTNGTKHRSVRSGWLASASVARSVLTGKREEAGGGEWSEMKRLNTVASQRVHMEDAGSGVAPLSSLDIYLF